MREVLLFMICWVLTMEEDVITRQWVPFRCYREIQPVLIVVRIVLRCCSGVDSE